MGALALTSLETDAMSKDCAREASHLWDRRFVMPICRRREWSMITRCRATEGRRSYIDTQKDHLNKSVAGIKLGVDQDLESAVDHSLSVEGH